MSSEHTKCGSDAVGPAGGRPVTVAQVHIDSPDVRVETVASAHSRQQTVTFQSQQAVSHSVEVQIRLLRKTAHAHIGNDAPL
jgi:hypothetical protein